MLRRTVDDNSKSANLFHWLVNALSFCIINLINIFLTTVQRSLLVITFSTWSSFNDIAKLSFKVFDSIALINSWVIKLMIWVIQDIEFCALFYEMLCQLSAFSSFFFKVSLLLALLITTSKSLFLMSYVFKILNSSCIKWWSVCSTWRDVNSMRCSWYWNVASFNISKLSDKRLFKN